MNADFSSVASDIGRGLRVSFDDLVIAALVMLPFTFALVLLVNATVWWPSPALIGLGVVVQGIGTVWNAGWRARTHVDGGE